MDGRWAGGLNCVIIGEPGVCQKEATNRAPTTREGETKRLLET